MNFNKLYKETVDGTTRYYAYGMDQWVEISKEVYRFLQASERKERYYRSCCRKHNLLSLERMIEEIDDNADCLPFNESLVVDIPETLFVESPEFLYLEEEKAREGHVLADRIKRMIHGLSGDEREMAFEILLYGKSIRQFAKQNAISCSTAKNRLDIICEKIRIMLLEEDENGTRDE